MEGSMKGVKDVLGMALLAVTAVLMLGAIYMVFVYAPDERTMGPVQRIFYFHVPSAIVTFSSVMVLLVASVAYLWTRRTFWDNLSRAATEIGLLFCTVVLITGPIWARPAWGTWWTWDARLTTTLILWLIYAAYLMLRSVSGPGDQSARYAAVLGIVGAVDIPIINRSVYWWRTIHPAVLVTRAGGTGLSDARMQATFGICFLAFFLLFLLLLWVRNESFRLRDALDELHQQALKRS
jgi:heme exporter protein C